MVEDASWQMFSAWIRNLEGSSGIEANSSIPSRPSARPSRFPFLDIIIVNRGKASLTPILVAKFPSLMTMAIVRYITIPSPHRFSTLRSKLYQFGFSIRRTINSQAVTTLGISGIRVKAIPSINNASLIIYYLSHNPNHFASLPSMLVFRYSRSFPAHGHKSPLVIT